MESKVIHAEQELLYPNQQWLDYKESCGEFSEQSSENLQLSENYSEIRVDRLSQGYEASFEDSQDFTEKSLQSDFFQDGWLSQFFFETCCQSCCFPVRRIDLSHRNVRGKIGRRLINTDIPPLLVFLRNNLDVITINLEYNDIGDCGFISIIEHANICQNIFGVNLSYNNVTEEAIKHMLQFTSSLNIKSLQLKGNSLNPEGVTFLAEFLKWNQEIVDLDVADVGHTAQSLSALINVLNPIYQSCNESLKILDISRPRPTTRYYVFNGDVVADWIGRLLKDNTRLLGLRLQKYSFSCHDIETLMMNAKYNKTLVSLDLGCNNIGDHGMQAISDWLSKRPALKILSLERNIITDHGARTLSHSLPSSKLLLLDISYNKITDDGMIDVLNSLKKSPQLQCLKIFGNRICDATARILRRMFLSKVLREENVDVRVWPLDNNWNISRHECEPCQLKYFLQPCCREPQLAAGCPTKAAYRRRYLRYTRVYERIAEEALPETEASEFVSCEEKHVTKQECNCCECLRARGRSMRESSRYSTVSEPPDYAGVSCSVFKEIGSNRSVLSLSMADDYCARREPDLNLIAPIIKNVRPEVGEKILRWINLNEETLQEDLESAGKLAKEERLIEPTETCSCNFLPVTISTILQYLKDEPANILLMQQDHLLDTQEEIN